MTDRTKPQPQAIVFWGATAVVLLSAVPLGSNRPLSWSLLSMALLLLFAVQCALDRRSIAAPRLAARLAPSAAAYIAILAWGAVQAAPGLAGDWANPAWEAVDALPAISIDPHMTWHHVMRGAAYGGAFWIAARACADPRTALRFIDVIGIWSTLLAFYAIIALSSGVNPVRAGIEAYASSATATFVNRNTYAFYAGIGLAANLAALIRRVAVDDDTRATEDPRRLLRSALERMFGSASLFLLGVVVTGMALALTQSRAGVTTGVAGASITAGLYLFRRRGGARLLVGVLAILAVGVGTATLSRLLGRIADVGFSSTGRYEIYGLILGALREAPWIGVGMGAFQEAFRPLVGAEFALVDVDHAHNVYLEHAFELGAPAAVVLWLAIGMITLRILRGARRRRRTLAAPCFAAGVAAAGALHGLVDFSLQTPAVAALFAMVLGAGWSQSWPSAAGLRDEPPQGRGATGAPAIV